MKIMKRQLGKVTQPILIVIVLVVIALLSIALLWSGKNKDAGKAEAESEGTAKVEGQAATEESEEGVELTPEQMTEQGVMATVALGDVVSSNAFPAKLVVNTDREAHVSPNFSGRVESVNVDLGQYVKKGQSLGQFIGT